MLNKLLAVVKKEMLLLLRDKVGLSVLFIMPVALILVMTLIQDSAFKSINEKGIPIIFVNNDKDSLGNIIEQGLRSNELCYVSDSIDGEPASSETAIKAVSEGKFLLGIVIPKGATAAIRKNVSVLVNETMNSADTSHSQQDSVDISILIDPVAKKSFLATVTSNLPNRASSRVPKSHHAQSEKRVAGYCWQADRPLQESDWDSHSDRSDRRPAPRGSSTAKCTQQ